MRAHIREVSLVRRSISLLIISILLAALLSGCGFKPISIELRTSAPLPLRQGDVITIAAVGKDSGSKERPVSVTWSADPAQAGTFSKLTGSSVTFTTSISYTGDLVISGVTDILQDTLSTEVYAPVLEMITVLPASWILADGGSKVFTASGTDQHGRTMAVSPEWNLSGDIGWVDPASGLSTTFYATALGTGTLTATQGTKTDSSDITVTAAPSVLTSVVVSPATATLRVGEQQGFTVQGLDQYGQPMAIEAEWSVTGGIGSVAPTVGDSTTFTAEAAGEGTVEATSSGIIGSASVTVTQKITLSGTIEDNEQDAPVPGAEVRAYREDRTLAATTFCDASGRWSMQPEIPIGEKVILQAGAPGYFIRTKGFDGVDASGLLMRIVPNDLEGFKEFMQDVCGDAPARFNSTDFQGFKILTQNPTGNGTFTLEEAVFMQNIIFDQGNKVDLILNTSGYSVVIDPSEPYTPGINKIYVLPDTDRTIGTAEIIPYGFGRVNLGGVIKINPTGLSESVFQAFLLHEIGHLIFPSHSSTTDSIMYYPSAPHNTYQPLDIKGTYISNEPTYIGRLDGTGGGISTDYLPNILGTEWGLDGLIGY